MAVNLVSVPIRKPDAINPILGQAHLIKTVEDLHEALVTAVPGIAFGLAFCESSGPCLVRGSGTDAELAALARTNARTSNPVEVIVAETATGRGILGVVDGSRPKGVETDDDIAARKALLRELGYKL